MKKLVSTLIALLITLLLMAYALRGVDFKELGTLLTGARYSALLPITLVLIGFFWLKALRWAVILKPLGHFSWKQVTPAMMIGFAGNNILPGRLGEPLRLVVFSRSYGKPLTSVFVSLVLERMLDVVAILALYILAVSFIDHAPQGLRASIWFVSVATVAAGALIALMLFRPELVLSLWEKCSRRLPRAMGEGGRAMLENGLKALSALKSPARLGLLLGNSILQWAVMAVNIWLSLWAFGVSITASVALIALAVTVLAIAIPTVPGYFGAIQAAFVFALTPFGVSDEVAFAASVMYLLAQWVPVTLFGVVFFLFTGFGISSLRKDVEIAEHSRT